MMVEEVKYKKTGIEWMPEVPEHWEMRRLGSIGKFSKGGNISRSELVNENEDNLAAAILYGDLYTKYEIVANEIFSKISKTTASKSVLLKKGDLLFTGSGETKEDIGKCVLFNSNKPAYAGGDVIIFKQDIFDGRFISYSQNSSLAKYQKYLSAKGEIIVHTYGSKLRDVVLPYPPIEEQKVIADYLDDQSAKITHFIQSKQRFIELLKEQRQGIVNKIVTKGIDNESNLVDSGFDWLGSIPNHWKMIRVKNVFELVTEQAPEGNNEVLLSIYSAIGVKPRKDMEQRGNKSTTTDGYWKVKQGDIIVNKLLAWMGAIGISEYEGVTSPAYDILRLKIDRNPFYYSELFRNSNIRGEFKKYSKGIMDVRLRLYFSEFGKIFIPVFPKDEQGKIVEHIKAETKTLDIAISKAEREIELIKEYREAMIAEAVMGKMKL